jgi:MFS family permease
VNAVGDSTHVGQPSGAEEYQQTPELDGARPWYLPRTFDAFRFRPFRWYMGAMSWWNAATNMQMLVRGYLAFRLTGSFTSLGYLSLGLGIPMLCLSPVGGVIADRTSRRTTLQIGQVASVFLALAVSALLFADRLEFWHLFIASIVHGVMFALVMPSRQALLPEVVGMRRLMNAIPLQTATMNVMQILAPAVGGFLVDWIGPSWVYLIMAGMYVVSVLMLFLVESLTPDELEASRTMASQRQRVADGLGPNGAVNGTAKLSPGGAGSTTALEDLSSGFKYIVRDRTVFTIISFSLLGSVLGMPILLLLPGYVGTVFGDDGSTLGLLQMGMGVGALVAALIVASLRMEKNRGLVLAGASLILGVSLIGFSLTGSALLAWFGLLAIGVGSTGRQTMSQVLVQEYVEDEYRGRVVSFFPVQFSLMSLGAFVVSIFMDSVGPEVAIGTLGVILLVTTTAYLALVPRLRNLA